MNAVLRASYCGSARREESRSHLDLDTLLEGLRLSEPMHGLPKRPSRFSSYCSISLVPPSQVTRKSYEPKPVERPVIPEAVV